MEPTNRELKIMLDNSHSQFVEKTDDLMRILREVRDDVKETKKQAQDTNGRVNLHDQILKDYPENIKQLTDVIFWKKYVLIAMAMMWSGLLIGIPLLVKYIKATLNRSADSTAQSVVETLEKKYDFKITH